MSSTKSEHASIAPPQALVKPRVTLQPLPPWNINGWSSQERRSIYRSWAQTYARTHHYAAAKHYFDMSIDDDGDTTGEFSALCMRSKFNRDTANPEESLADSKRAARIAPWNVSVNLHISDALYDLNRFEDNKMMLHNNVGRFVGTSKIPFEQRILCVNSNYPDNVGDSLSPFFLKHSAKLRDIYEKILKPPKPEVVDMRWRILSDKTQENCDVQSVVEKEEIKISPLDAARRKRKTKIFYQNYLHDAWIDIAFIKTLRRNPTVLLDKYYNSATERKNYLNQSYARIQKFTRMLHARSPIYNESFKRFSNPEFGDRMHQANMFRIQYQTRRNMFSILSTVRSLREQKDTPRLRKYVSKVMHEFNVVKTKRVMPWKMEFMNEVYNNLALSLCESYRMPEYRVSPYDNDVMCRLLGVQHLRPAEPQFVVFGERDTYTYDDSGPAYEEAKAYKRTTTQLENRLHFARMPLERCYLLYEIADLQLAHNHQMQSLQNAKKSIDEARRAGSKIWEFLATMLEAKVHAVLGKYERQADVLNRAYRLAKDLKSPYLCTFIELCRMLNRDYMTLRKMSMLAANRRMRSKISARSSCVSTAPDTPPPARRSWA